MSDEDLFDKILDVDWGDAWEKLRKAPPLVLVPPKSAQLTLRLPAEMVTALKEVANRKTLPYHALARSWIVDGVRDRQVPTASEEVEDLGTRGDVQVNLKLTAELLRNLKAFSHEIRQPYHRLARLWIGRALRNELEAAASHSSPHPSLPELMILLLDAPSPQAGDSEVRGISRLQKLLFVIEKRLSPDPTRSYAYKYGNFDEQVNDVADALQLKGLLEGKSPPTTEPPIVDEMMASVLRRAGPRDEPDKYSLSPEGRAAAAQLRRSNNAYEQLAERIRELRQEWDRPDLIERVYEEFPEYTGRSLIKEKVSRRAEARKRRSL
jgi:hypothetical protein